MSNKRVQPPTSRVRRSWVLGPSAPAPRPRAPRIACSCSPLAAHRTHRLERLGSFQTILEPCRGVPEGSGEGKTSAYILGLHFRGRQAGQNSAQLLLIAPYGRATLWAVLPTIQRRVGLGTLGGVCLWPEPCAGLSGLGDGLGCGWRPFLPYMPAHQLEDYRRLHSQNNVCSRLTPALQ
jgi:hypothetical protein